MPGKRVLQMAGLITGVITVQLLTRFTGTGYFLTQLTMSAYYSLVIIGLCLLIGYAGQISLGHAGFFAMGGYISALLTTYNLLPYKDNAIIAVLMKTGILVVRTNLYGSEILYFQPWVACIIAVSMTVLVAYLIGGPILKLKGHYLAMATLGLGIIVYRIVLGSAFFGEADGLSEVPAFTLLPGLKVSGNLSVRISNYYIAWGLVIIAFITLLNLVDSRVGRALRSIHGAEDASSAVGVNTAKYKLNTFVLSAAFASIAGVFLTHYNGGIGPSEASVMKSVRYVAIVAVGGMANLWGALIMGVLLNFLSLRGYFGSFDDAVFGGILIVIMLFAPEGLIRVDIFRYLKRAVSGEKAGEQNDGSS
ncbi:leucine/isoleucine/valine transporter permease subunit [bacterium BMS3Abin07]|nr:leucine/isoleucine/valine transporter permease subunit [bacterium BMS3Abin07]GBE31428.1 leucine/isoleucine/valine transporter permease subunit [bacterium BMS3Bbin05]HDL21257.1 branched-chain amino acid ABC transporter permease [Nitrospirota bacterium]HDO22179.1 branched-chain amino acid ABC transporter permease [Nitrospirota bacterium]